jgi:sugar phosphate isomerase/epimerase
LGGRKLKQRLLLGMPTLIECQDIEQNIELCKELGLDFVEISMNLPQFQIDQIDRNYYKSLMKEHNIFFTLHLPEKLNIADFDPNVRNAYIHTTASSINLAKEIGIPLINMHMIKGVYFTLPNQKVYLFDKYKDDYMRYIRSFGGLVSSLISNENICVSIENTGIYNLSFIRDAVSELLRRDCFSLTWDIGHDYSSGDMDTDFILSNIKCIRHFHIHDAVGKSNHLPLGDGEMDLQSKIDIAKTNNCTCVIETKTIQGLRKSIEDINSGIYHF